MTRDQFKRFLLRAKGATAAEIDGIVEGCYAPILASMEEFVGASPLRRAHYLAQLAHESSRFRRFEENLNYTTAQRLRQVWPARFGKMTDAQLAPFVRNAPALAERVYSGRMGNGPEGSGDGWRYRGSGAKMITGKSNFAAAGRALGLDLVGNPDLLRKDRLVGFRAAGDFWKTCGAAPHADKNDMLAVSRIINVGNAKSTVMPVGLDDRRTLTDLAIEILGVHPVPPRPPATTAR
jgi:putative chitinase